MKKKLFTITAAFAIAGGIMSAGPASAEDGYLCMTTENAPFYTSFNGEGGVGYLFTLSAGRGFRTNGTGGGDYYDRAWIGGHGAEHPDREGYTLQSHTTCT